MFGLFVDVFSDDADTRTMARRVGETIKMEGCEALTNLKQFNGNGIEYAARNLAAKQHRPAILGVNVGANKTSADPIEDYHVAVARLAAFADYITLNISSPNTPGLRDLQADQLLQHLLAAGK